jgi:glycosyltransferase involved in cell wall biosynthesis
MSEGSISMTGTDVGAEGSNIAPANVEDSNIDATVKFDSDDQPSNDEEKSFREQHPRLLIGLWGGPTMVGGFFQKWLRRQTKVLTVGPELGLKVDIPVAVGDPICPVAEKLKAEFDIYVQFYSKPDYFPPDLYLLKCPKVWVLYDLHLHAHELSRSCALFDICVVPDEKSKVQLLERGVTHVIVMPFAVDPEIFYRPFARDLKSRRHEVGFSGSVKGHPQLAEREALLNAVGEKHRLKVEHRSLTGAQVADFYQTCDVVLNQAVHHDLNMRIMEVLISGRPLLTPRVDGINDLLVEGEHALVYDSKQDLLDKLQALLSDPEKREEMAKRGQEHAVKAHTYEVRSTQLLKALQAWDWKNLNRCHHLDHLKFCQFSYHWFRFPGDALVWLKVHEFRKTKGMVGFLLQHVLGVMIFMIRILGRVKKVHYFQPPD